MAAFIGVGIITVAPYSSGATFAERAFVDTGNNSVLQDSFAQTENSQKNYRTLSGGTYATDNTIDTFTINITGHDFTPDNLSRALWGTSSDLVAGSVTGEAHALNFGKVMVLDEICDDTQSVSIDVGGTALDSADYTVSGSMVSIVAAPVTAGVSDGDACTVDYTKKGGTLIEVLTTAAPVVSVFFDGFNKITGKASKRRYWKCTVGAPTAVDAISDSFASLPLVLTANSDETIVGTGLSKYAQILNEA